MTPDAPDRGGPEPSTVAMRLAAVRRRIAAAARSVDRDPADVRLVAVSKLHPLERVLAAHAAGQEEFGESRAQELDAKLADARAASLRWHFVGRLQRNKVPLVVGRVELIHSVDRRRLVTAIGDHLYASGGHQDVLLQVNVTGEQRKGGCAPDALPSLAEAVARTDGLAAVGLMAIPPLDVDPAIVFDRLRELRDRIAATHPGVVELSMGMSGDLEIAVAHGATIVRVGTDVFGARPSNQ
ncbi:MAG TPA: YggS family pyridoxal phosphate-dependent enzyme [Euzebyales bacterium]